MPVIKINCPVCQESIFKRTMANARCSSCLNEIHMPCWARLVLVDGMREGCFACDSKDPVTEEQVAELQRLVDEGKTHVYYTADERLARIEKKTDDINKMLAEVTDRLFALGAPAGGEADSRAGGAEGAAALGARLDVA